MIKLDKKACDSKRENGHEEVMDAGLHVVCLRKEATETDHS